MRKFEKISYNIFKKEVCDDKKLYEKIEIPKRSTINSAGYDIRSIEGKVIKPGEVKKIKTGIKVSMYNDEVLYIYIRSSLGFKHNISLINNVGVIDSDYYNNPDNEGHIQICLINLGNDDYIVNVGDKIAQGVFMKYLTVEEEEQINTKRHGGIGSTGK